MKQRLSGQPKWIPGRCSWSHLLEARSLCLHQCQRCLEQTQWRRPLLALQMVHLHRVHLQCLR